MLTNRALPRAIVLPHEPETTVMIRYLSGLQLAQARIVAQSAGTKRLREMGAEFVQATLAAADPAAVAAVQTEIVTDPLRGLDRTTVLHAGIVGWSYYDSPPLAEDIDALDEESAQYIAEQIVAPARTETERGNGSASSTTSSTAEPSPFSTIG